MAKKRKPGAGRKPVPDDKKKTHLTFRAEPFVHAAFKRLADENGRSVSGEILFQVKQRLKDIGAVK